MRIKVAQIKYRVANFEYNYEQISKNFDETVDVMIFPDFETGDTLKIDSRYTQKKNEFLEKLCKSYNDKTFLIGCNLIKDGKLLNVEDCFINIDDKKFYISKTFNDGINCDTYILCGKSYYAKESHTKLIENTVTSCNLIYVNPIMLEDENVYAGQSFVKNSDNELVYQAELLKETVFDVCFNKKEDLCNSSDIEEIYNITTFALKEYCDIIGFKEVVLGLSGGIDSAVTAVLASDALGAKNVYTIMMPSKYSSEGSITDSEKLVNNLGINVETRAIKELFDCFMNTQETKHDLAEENLQSRLRGLILMFNSNRYNRLLLSTGNKSEIACGYGTLYGDMCGGLNLIADLTKTNVYKLANYINRDREIIPQEIIDKPPSAELRPNQKDSDSLPEYDILDKIIEDFVEQNLSYYELTSKYEKDTVNKTLKLIYRAQFKRNQACLGIRLTENAFCSNIKLPVLQGLQ